VQNWWHNGVNHITIVPMFLGVGRHAREDLPELVAATEGATSNSDLSLAGRSG